MRYIASLSVLLLLSAMLAASEFHITVLNVDGKHVEAAIKVRSSTGKVVAGGVSPNGEFTMIVDSSVLPVENTTVSLDITASDGARLIVNGLNGASKDVQRLSVRLPKRQK